MSSAPFTCMVSGTMIVPHSPDIVLIHNGYRQADMGTIRIDVVNRPCFRHIDNGIICLLFLNMFRIMSLLFF